MTILREVLLLVAVSLTLLNADDSAIPCPGGECVKLHLCREGEIITDGAGLIDIRFNPEDPCEHYLLKCCNTDNGDEIVVPPVSHGGGIPGGDGGAVVPSDNHGVGKIPGGDGGVGVPPSSHGSGNVPGGDGGVGVPPGTHGGGNVPGDHGGLVVPPSTHGGGNLPGDDGFIEVPPSTHGGGKLPGGDGGIGVPPSTHGDGVVPGGGQNQGGTPPGVLPVNGHGCQPGNKCHNGIPGDVDNFGHDTGNHSGSYIAKPPIDPSAMDHKTEPGDNHHCQGNQCTSPDHGGGPAVPAVTPGPPKTTELEGCGFRNADGVGFRITGNTDGESEYGEFPWMVAILKEEKALDEVINVYQCGGSLIHPQVVLTAAHCVQNKRPNEIKIRLGEWDTQTTNEMYDHQDRNVVDIVVHEQFYKGGLFNDVALLFLDVPAEFISTVNTVCLPPQDFSFDLNRCFASGWGKDVFGKEGKYQVILKKIELPVMPSDQCQAALRTTRLGKRFVLNKSFICAGGEPGRDTCKGDGGSPLVCPIPGTNRRYYQAGIVAWGIGCGETGIPGVYVKVAGFRKWIDDHLTQRNIPHNYYIPV